MRTFFKTGRYLLLTLIATGFLQISKAQEVALKTNILSDALADVNIGAEVTVAPKWSVGLEGDFNFWTLDNGRKWKHWLAIPQARYWFCEATAGHFIGIHLLGGEYNIGQINLPFTFLGTDFRVLKENRYQGWLAGAGISYGYSWLLSKHWNLEAEIGIGYIYTRSDKYECSGCGHKVESDISHNYYGPTKAAVNLVYVF